jgi:hypothetical protein
MKTTLLATALALCAASASAQMIHTSVSLDGHKSFSDRAETIAEPVAEAVAARRTPAGTMARGSRGAVLVNANEAERRLAQAQRKRSKGMALQSGESDRIHGGVVVNTRYWIRQQGLDLEVDRAQRRANEVRQLTLAQR